LSPRNSYAGRTTFSTNISRAASTTAHCKSSLEPKWANKPLLLIRRAEASFPMVNPSRPSSEARLTAFRRIAWRVFSPRGRRSGVFRAEPELCCGRPEALVRCWFVFIWCRIIARSFVLMQWLVRIAREVCAAAKRRLLRFEMTTGRGKNDSHLHMKVTNAGAVVYNPLRYAKSRDAVSYGSPQSRAPGAELVRRCGSFY
jgi:hypothetical protein